MIDDACPTCGKPLGVVDVEGRHIHAEPGDDTSHRRAPRRAGIAVAVVAALIVAGVLALSGDDGSDEIDAAASRERQAGSTQGAEPTQLQRDLAATTDAFSALLGDKRVAYASEGGAVALVGVRAPGVSSVVQVVPEVAESSEIFFRLGDFAILNRGDLTYAIDADNDDVIELYNHGPLVRTAEAFTIGQPVEPEEDRVLVGTSGGFILTWVDIPVGSVSLMVPEVGVLAMPPSGGSFIARPGGLQPFSEHRIVGANATHHLEVRCDEELTCRAVLVDRVSESEVEVPAELAQVDGDISISPDGAWVILLQAGDDIMLDVVSGSMTEVELADAVYWSPDSSFVAWLSGRRGHPLLTLYRPASDERDQLDLAVLGAPDRIADDLVIFG